MELSDVTDIIVSLIKESNFKVNEFNNQVEQHHNFLEELYLEAHSKLTAPCSAGMIILPKTPAPKRGRKAKNTKKEAEVEKENINDTDEQQASPVFSRSGRAASKAATVKIKESQRMLNDLSSKRRRPDDSQDKEQMLTSIAESDAASSKKNRYAGKDSGISDTSCSTASTTSSRGRPSKTQQRLRLQELLKTDEEDNKQEEDDECQLQEQEVHRELKPDVQSECDNRSVKSVEKAESSDIGVENVEEMVNDKENNHNKSIESQRCYYSPQPDIKYQQKQTVVVAGLNNSSPHKNINASVDGNIPNSPVIIATKDKLNTSSIVSNSVAISDSSVVPKDVDTESLYPSSAPPTTSVVPPAAQFAVPLDCPSNKVLCESKTRSTRTKIRYIVDVDQHTADETDRPARTTRTKKRQAEQDSLHQPEVVATAGRTTRTKKRKMEEEQQNLITKPVEDVVCLVLSESEDEFDMHNTRGRASNISVGSTVSIASTARAGASSNTVKNVSQGNQRCNVFSVVNEEHSSVSSIVSGNAVVVMSKLSPAVLANTVGATACNENKVTIKGSPPRVFAQILGQEKQEHCNVSDESENENDADVEEVSPVQRFHRITRSKVRQQQQPLPVPVSPKVTAALRKTGATTSGKFSPRPFGNRVGVKQLAAAYSEHVAAATTPAKNDRPRPLPSRPSSLSRVQMNVSRVTPTSCNRVRPGMLSTASSDSHHYRHGSKVFTPSQGRRPANLVTGMKSFLSSGVAVQQPRLTREEVEEQRLEEIRRKREREEEIRRNKEERIRSKAIEAKRRNEERQRKAQEARAASVRRAADEADRKAAELAERKAAELAERLEVERRTRDERLKQEALRKKKREVEEKRRRQEEEARKRKEEAEENRRVEAERREFLRQQEEEQRLLKERKAEEEKRAQEERQRREAERLAREKEELRLLKEKEATRLLAAQQQKQKEQEAKLAHPLNVTFDANKTYTTAANAAPKTPMNCAAKRHDSYEMTPAQDEDANNYCIEDLRSDDSSDDDTNPKKKVPLWATRAELSRALVRQEYHPPQLDVIFPAVLLLLVPDLTLMFKVQRARFKVRSSSAQWKTPPHKVFSNIK